MEKKVYCFKNTHNFYKECEEVVKSNAKSVVQGQVYANQFKVEEWAIDENYFLISKEDYKLKRKDKKLFSVSTDSNWCKLKNTEIVHCVSPSSFYLVCPVESRYIIDDVLYIVTLGEVFEDNLKDFTIITFDELNDKAKKSFGGILTC